MGQMIDVPGQGQVEFPDGMTDEAIVAAIKKNSMTAAPRSDISVPAVKSWTNQAIAGLPDALLNTPNNLINLGKAGFGTAATAAGRPDLAPSLTPNPNYITRGAEALGLVNPSLDPHTAGGRVAKMAVQGATVGAVAPAKTIGQIGLNMALGGTSSLLGQGTTEATGSVPLGQAVAIGAVPAASAGINAMRSRSQIAKEQSTLKDATLKEAQDAGYVVPPSASGGGFASKRMESVAGKAAIGQEAAVRNQKITNELARKEVGLPDNSPITEGALAARRDVLAQPYREVASLSTAADAALEQLKSARHQSSIYWKHYDMSADPNSLNAAKKFDQAASGFEAQIANIAQKSGKPGLALELKEARTAIAKTHDVERALNVATGDVSAPVLGRMLDKGAPLTGGLKTAAKFHQAFPSYARPGETIPTPGVSKSEALVATMLGAGGGAAFGPGGVALAALPLASGPTRSMLLSQPGQAMATPRYFPSNLPMLSDPFLRGILASGTQQQ